MKSHKFMRFIAWVAIAITLHLPALALAGQGMGPGPGVKAYAGGGGCGAGTITHIQDVGDVRIGGGTSFAAPSWTITSGNYVAVYVTWDSTGSHTMAVTDSLGNAVNPTTAARRGPSSNGQYIEAYFYPVTTGGTGFLTAVPSASSGSIGIYAMEIHISSGSIALDQEVYNAPGSASTTPTSTALTPACNGSIAMGMLESGGTGTVGAGWTTVDTAQDFVTSEYQIQTTAASLQANYTTSSSIYGAGMIILKPQ